MPNNLFIYGAGGAGREILDIVYEGDSYEQVFFLDDYVELPVINNVKVIRTKDFYKNFNKSFDRVIISLGEPVYRKKLFEEIISQGALPEKNVISKRAEVSKFADIEKGVIIDKNSVISPNTFIEKNTYIGRGVIVGHDTKIGENCVICAGTIIGGHVEIKDNSFIGSGVTVRDNTTIGAECIVGIGSNVVADLRDRVVAYGNPAKVAGCNERKLVFGGR